MARKTGPPLTVSIAERKRSSPRIGTIAVIGLVYVGLPVAVAFARSGAPVIGFDIDARFVEELRAGHDRMHELEPRELAHKRLVYASDAAAQLWACRARA